MKKALSIILAMVIMLLVVQLEIFSLPVNAATSYNSDYYTYTILNGEATITDVDTSIGGDVSIPATLGGYSVTSIGDYAFYDCLDLTSITIGDSVTNIGKGAFSHCLNLESIFLDKANTTYYCKNHCLIDKATNELVLGCNNSVIPNEVTRIGDYAFSGRSGLTSVTIPDSVTIIGNGAFEHCYNLTSVIIPNSVIDVSEDAFVSCSNLICNEFDNAKYLGNSENPYLVLIKATSASITSCNIHNETRFISSYAFNGCPNLARIAISDSVTSIGYMSFAYCPMTSIIIPDSVTRIGDYAFYGCPNLASVAIPNSVTSIGGWVFCRCSNLTSVTISDSVTSIGKLMFYECEMLTSVMIPEGVISIGDYAFSGCSDLKSVTIPDSVTSIGGFAFSECSELTDVYYVGSVNDKSLISISSGNEPLLNANWYYDSCVSAILLVNAAKAEVQTAIDKKADITTLNTKVDELMVAINTAENVAKTYTDSKVTELTIAIQTAKDEAVCAANDLVNSAKAELQAAIDKKADITTLNTKVDELMVAINTAENVAKAYTDSKITELIIAIQTAKDEAVCAANDLVNAAKAELRTAIDKKADASTVNAAIANLQNAITSLQNAKDNYITADATLKAELEAAIAQVKQEAIDAAKGYIPYIGTNGNWWIGDTDTGVDANGNKGDTSAEIVKIEKTATNGNEDTYTITLTNGKTFTFTVTNGTNGKDGIDGKDGENGKDGLTPFIGENGNWWIGNSDTGVPATAESTPVISDTVVESNNNIITIIAIVIASLALVSNIVMVAWLLNKKKKL